MRRDFPFKTPFEDTVIGSTLELKANVRKRALCPDVFEYTIDLAWDAAKAREENAAAAVLFHLPCVDLQYMWQPDSRSKRVLDADWRLNIQSMLTNSAPVAVLFNGEGNNAYTFAHNEVRKITSVEFGVQDEGGSSSIAGKIEIGLKQFGAQDHTTLLIRADFRRVPFHEALNSVREWWEAVLPIHPMHVPDSARKPVYSSWYNFHKDILGDTLEKECRIAKEMGMDTIIVDDGWQAENNAKGYGFTGDWKPWPGKFPDFRAFVNRVHQIGMNVMLWYSVPFIGYFSANWERFKGMILRREERNNTGILDPRYPQVREFLKGVYVSALKDYDLDGLKLDFIDRFQNPDLDEIQPGMDFACVQEAADAMMIDIRKALEAVKPGILIEFRQRYIGPCMRQFGNMFRVSDCPGDITTNRVGIADLRMLSGNTAVHSDMITWHDADQAEDAALQVLNTIFGVTQVSKILGNMRPDHKKMLSFWLSFARGNQKILQQSGFVPAEPQNLYPIITAGSKEEEIIGVYADNKVLHPDWRKKKIQLINATWQPKLIIYAQENTVLTLNTYDCMGQAVYNGEYTVSAGLHEIGVPRSGLAVLERKI